MSLWAPKDPSELDQMATTLYSSGWHIEWFLFSIHVALSVGYGNLSSPLLFLLNARDENCDHKFVWCDQNSIIGPEYPWADMEPNNFVGNEMCINFWLLPNRKKPVLSDEACTSKKFFICEVLWELGYFLISLRLKCHLFAVWGKIWRIQRCWVF
jgi:hypothetical protein